MNRRTFRNRDKMFGRVELLEAKQLLTVLVDLDVDGDLDALYQSAWYENSNGQGDFVRHEYLESPVSTSIAVDLDNDGDADVITSEPSWFENTGDGTLVRHTLPQPVADAVDKIQTTDVGGDGNLDIVLYAGDQVTLLKNDGEAFQLDFSAELPGVSDAADFDGDGDLDWLSTVNGSLAVHINDGGAFTKQTLYAYFSDEFTSIASTGWWGDLDGDQQLELVHWRSRWDDFGSASDDLYWIEMNDALAGNTAAEVRMQGPCSYGVPGGQGRFKLVDWNKDGVTESWCLGDGYGDREAAAVMTNPGNGQLEFASRTAAPELRFDFEIRGLTDVGDLNGDGTPDLIGTTQEGGILQWIDGVTGRVYERPTDFVFTTGASDVGGNANDDEIELVDVDGDGDLEAIIAGDRDQIEIWQIETDGEAIEFVSAQTVAVDQVIYLDTGDVDGDGDVDIVAASRTANRVLINDGAGVFLDSGQALGDQFTIDVALGDLDFDGDLDIFSANFRSAPNRVWLNDGTGTFSDSGQRLGIATSKSVELADMDADGDLDAVVGNMTDDHGASSQNRIWINDGSGAFPDASEFGGEHDTQHVAVADLDQDGFLDMFAVNSESSHATDQVFIQQNWRGNVHWTEQPLGNGGPGSHVALGDLDNDGDFDAVVANWSGQPNRVWINQGRDGFATAGDRLGDSTSSHVALGDVDNDGDLEAVFANYGQNVLYENPLDPETPPGGKLLPPESVPRADDHSAEADRATRLAGPIGEEVVTATGEINFEHDIDAFVFPVQSRGRYRITSDHGRVAVYQGSRLIRGEELFYAENGNADFQVLVLGDVGAYELSIQLAMNDHGNERRAGTSVDIPSSTSGVLAATDDEDWFRFEPEIGKEYDIIVRHDSVPGTDVRVYHSSGPYVARNAAYGPANQLLYVHQPRFNPNGITWIVVSAASCEPRVESCGDYTLTIRESTGEVVGDIPGDSNLDGEFNSGDLVYVFSFGEYDDGIAGNSTWQTGDWNRDGEFDSADFVYAFTAGSYRG